MLFLYTIATRFYFLGIRVASIFNVKAAVIIKGHKNWRQKLAEQIEPNSEYIWMHCASLGEFEQGRPLIEKFKSDPLTKNYKIILSFFSSSGYEVRKNYQFADIVCYLPFDTKKNARDFVKILKPNFAVFVKYEFWHYYLDELHSQKIPAYCISAIFREKQMFFKPYGKFFLKTLHTFKHIFVQDENSKRLLTDKNITNVDVCGDTRMDRVIQIASEKYENIFLDEFSSEKHTIVCGSTWPEDEEILSQFINASDEKFRFIIAPHEVNNKHIRGLLQLINKSVILYSDITNQAPNDYSVVIIDTIGLLSKLYRFGEIAFIGGGFGKGIHNVLEAAVYDIAVVFGPNYKKFKEAEDLVEIGAGFSIKTLHDLTNIINNIINNKLFTSDTQNKAKAYISHSSGSTQHIFTKLHLIGEF
ncbi:MAG: glycosyltransferase N-terminal domain-containing protein [Bacteroidales bacterium]|nr:glycosyltransferase N-terminal domain-containing protein [Bacteroidales bacterium]MDY0140929.1 glycosyltransferase N-terminal domain-containing protein [Bacteroidales bacterium]